MVQKQQVCVAIHIVKAGDTLYTISKLHNIPVPVLMQVNKIMNPYGLRIGQRVCIPGEAPSPVPLCPAPGILHTIVQNDTFYLLSKRYNVPMEAIMNANPGLDPYNLQVGTSICIPSVTTVPVPAPPVFCDETERKYTIEEGDTLYLIARKYNITLEALMKANPALDPYHLTVGTIICIPPEVAAPAPAPEPAPAPAPAPAPTPVPAPMPAAPSMPTWAPGLRPYQTPSTPGPSFPMPNLPFPGIPVPMPMPIPGTPEPTTPAPTKPVTCVNGTTIKIKDETIADLLEKYPITFAGLAYANPDVDFTKSLSGMTLCIPNMDIFITCLGEEDYVVRSSDNLRSIARRLNISTDQLIMANPGLRYRDYEVTGLRLCVPSKKMSQKL